MTGAASAMPPQTASRETRLARRGTGRIGLHRQCRDGRPTTSPTFSVAPGPATPQAGSEWSPACPCCPGRSPRAPRLPGADCADVVQSTWPRLQEAVLTLAIRGIDVLNLSLGCFDNEPDSHLVMAHPVEHLHVTSTTSGPSPPGRRSGSRHRAAVPRLVALVRHVPVGCHRLRSDRRGDGRKAAHYPQAVTCCARHSSGPAARPSPETAYRRCRSYGQWTGRRCLWTTRPQQQARVCRGPGGGAVHVPPSEGRWEACLRPHWTEVCAAPTTCRQTGAGARRSGRRAAGRRSR